MGVKYFLKCVRKHKSNLSTNICTTLVGKKTQLSVEKCELLSETTFSPYFMTAAVWCFFFFTKVCIILPMVFNMFFITTVCFYDFCITSQQYASMIFVKQCW